MIARRLVCVTFVALAWLLGASTTAAQSAGRSAVAEGSASGVWAVLGGGLTAVRRGCQTCDEQASARQTGNLLAQVGYAVNRRTAVGAEVAWIPVKPDAGRRSTMHLDAIVQFTPWSTRGFFVKGGAGMAFVRYALDPFDVSPATSKALSLVLGAGWTWRRERRVAIQVFGSHHAAALGDLQTAAGQVNDVLTNFWSSGVALLLR